MKNYRNTYKATILLCVASVCISTFSCKNDKKTLRLYNWTYYTPDSVIAAFEEKYGVTVIYDDFASNEDMFAKLMAGSKGYDLVVPSADYTAIMIKLNMLEPIDIKKIPNTRYIKEDVRLRMDYDPEMHFSIPYYMGAAGIAVNTKEVPNYEKSWDIFARKDLKNRMTMLDDMHEVLGSALAVLGYSVNSRNEKELEEAYHLIQTQWKPNLIKFDADGFAKSFASGDYLVVHSYAESIFEEISEEQRKYVDFFIPKDANSPLYIDNFCIPKGAKNPELAHKFINFILQPEIYAEFLDTFGFPASIHSEAAKYTKKTPNYTLDDMKHCVLKKENGPALDLYNTYWQKIRFTP